MLLGLRGEALAVLSFEDCAPEAPASPRQIDAAAPWLAREAARQIDQYLAGRRRDFELPLDARGSAFAQRAWRELCALRYGERVGYAALAGRLGLDAGHARAVGRAVGANPLLLLVPCHRVVGSDGAPRGYAGGVARKLALLELESSRLG
jgi:methylated-DNA-[protein]-cysteine S-methyltransferase